ncbi:MAG: hypothetical protein C0478_14505 [Planctomyces sp.]|nr:hypothetical protein [Planctomyces sp.]
MAVEGFPARGSLAAHRAQTTKLILGAPHDHLFRGSKMPPDSRGLVTNSPIFPKALAAGSLGPHNRFPLIRVMWWVEDTPGSRPRCICRSKTIRAETWNL